MNKFKYYVRSFRLRTLPLSLSGILLGSMLAYAAGAFDNLSFGLAIVTTLCLQILSNLANELGDLQKGTDNENRLGPIRSVQSGALTLREFYRVILLFVALSFVSGISLVFCAFHSLLDTQSIIMLLLGGTAIIAAIKYTVGENAYGYRGLGDLFVFLFFGLLSTIGAWFLMMKTVTPDLFLPAAAIGLLSTGVLNMNNIRDIRNDALYGKRTIPVLLGERHAKIYHFCLIIGALLCTLIYTVLHPNHLFGFLFLLTLPLFIVHLKNVVGNSGRTLDPQLRFLSLSTLLLALLTGAGQIL